MSHWWGQEQECLQTRGRGPMAWGATVAPWSGLVGWWMRRWGKACWILLASVGSLLGRKGLNLNGKMDHLIYIIFLWDWKHLRLFRDPVCLAKSTQVQRTKIQMDKLGVECPKDYCVVCNFWNLRQRLTRAPIAGAACNLNPSLSA